MASTIHYEVCGGGRPNGYMISKNSAEQNQALLLIPTSYTAENLRGVAIPFHKNKIHERTGLRCDAGISEFGA